MKPSIARSVMPAAALLIGTAHGGDFNASTHHQTTEYRVTELDSFDGTSRGNSINNLGWISGYSTSEDGLRRASVWLYGFQFDLGALGGDDARSSVVWPVKNDRGLIVGISQTDTPDPNGETWSCAPFLLLAAPGPTCLGVAWEWGQMRPLPTLGGYNGFAAGANNLRQITGWTETDVFDTTCDPNSTQVLQFKPVIWGPGRNQVRALPLIGDDTSGAATAINDRGQAVGISGDCDQGVGRESARHAVLWERDGTARDLGNLDGAEYWNTPMAINRRGDVVVGFAGQAGDFDGNFTKPFIWTMQTGMQELDLLEGDVSGSANAVNERGQVVGASCDESGACTAVMWVNGALTDLNEFKGDYAGFLVTAQDINDFGVITGRALREEAPQNVAFKAVPTGRHRRHAGPIPKPALPDHVKREIVQPMSPAHARLNR